MDADTLKTLIPFLIPLVILQLGLMVYCLIDLARRENTHGPKWLWVIVVVLGELVGPVIYLIFGRREE